MSGALIAMSGGVDSSVAAALAVRQGLRCVACTMALFKSGACCSAESAADARSAAAALGIPFYVFNFSAQFREHVIDRFIADYRRGRTPNPCVDCNRFLKFGLLLRRARELGLDYVVTGHYAVIEKDASSGRFLLKKAADKSKDQSYALYAMTQEQLASVLFPVGALPKTRVRELAAELGLVNARKPDSQDICFVPDGDYAGFIERAAPEPSPPGDFVDMSGRVLGRHRGIIHYTIGQRRGLGIAAPEPLYVRAIDAASNTVTLGGARDVYFKTLLARSVNLIAAERIDAPVRLAARVRYSQPEQPARVWQTDEDTLRVEFERPQRAPARGQAAVLYDGDVVVGGGTIEEVL